MFDLAIIGAGWAGYNAAIRAKDLNLKVALIEKSFIGGTCLNKGCIPTKSLIQSARVFSLVKKSSLFGIKNSAPEMDFLKAQERKDKIIESLRLGMASGLKGVDFLNGQAELLSANKVLVAGKIIEAKFILISTGSCPMQLSELEFDGKRILSSDEMLSMSSIPPSLLIVGGGVIGCEFASLFSNLGSRVTIVEKADNLLPLEDLEVSRKIEASFRKRGINVNTRADVSSINLDEFQKILVAVGRKSNINIPGIEKAGVLVNNGKIKVDEYLRTSVENIYAAGDCSSDIMLANFAGYQGVLAADNISGKSRKVDSSRIPNVVFTDPEAASVGLNEKLAKEKGFSVNIHRFDYMASAMARIIDETSGFVKLISESKTGIFLGASIVGPKATEMIGILSTVLSSRLKIDDLKSVVFAHPTIAESIGEALK